jgi:hypothetical protein
MKNGAAMRETSINDFRNWQIVLNVEHITAIISLLKWLSVQNFYYFSSRD